MSEEEKLNLQQMVEESGLAVTELHQKLQNYLTWEKNLQPDPVAMKKILDAMDAQMYQLPEPEGESK